MSRGPVNPIETCPTCGVQFRASPYRKNTTTAYKCCPNGHEHTSRTLGSYRLTGIAPTGRRVAKNPLDSQPQASMRFHPLLQGFIDRAERRNAAVSA